MVNSWLPRLSQHSAPIKEGRSHPSSPMFKRKSRQKWTAYVLLAAAAVWLIITQFSATASFPDVESLRMFHGGGSLGEFILSNIAEMPAGDKYSQQSTLDASFENTDENNDAKSALPDGLSAALENVFSIIPDEIYRQKLMQPITLTGSRKLRELGLRSRAYKRFLEAWEKLHLFTEDDDDIYYVRDNLVPYMRAKFSQEIFPEALHRYESYRHFLTQFSTLLFPWTSPYFADHMSLHASLHHGGRGIVVLAGDNHAQFLLTSIPSLRKRGCELPIEVFYLGDRDLREDFRLELEALPGVTTRDLSIMVNDNGWRLNGWAGKPFSILLSSFREVILIDADSLFFVNPEELFDDEDYVRTGALFFKDRLISPESKREWLLQILPKPISKQVLQSRLWTGQSGHMQESGVVVVDKWKHFVTLLLVCRLNGPDRDGKQAGTAGMYNMVYGLSTLTHHCYFKLTPVTIQVTRKRSGSAGNSPAILPTPFTPALPE
jgi:alpha 1,3-mannosyltransferase